MQPDSFDLIEYDPHVSRVDDKLDEKPNWEEISKNALYYGVQHIDEANPAGIDLEDGQVIEVRGEKKHRKTTFALNCVRRWCLEPHRLRGGKVLWETLESGQTPRLVKQSLVCLHATSLMARELYGYGLGSLPVVKESGYTFANMEIVREARDPAHSPHGPGNLFRLSRDYAMTADRTPLQHEMIIRAREEIDEWPLIIFGAPRNQGWTKMLESAGNGRLLDDCLPFRRWRYAVENFGVKVIVVDHAIAYNGANDYDKMNNAIVHISAAVSELHVVLFIVAQISLTARRAGDRDSRGGTRYSEEAHLVLDTFFKKGDWFMEIDCGESRGKPFPRIAVPMEPNSGLLFPSSVPLETWKQIRRGTSNTYNF